MAPVYVLGETSAGYVLFKSKDKKILKRQDLANLAASVEDTCNTLKLKSFVKFDNAAAAVSEATAIGEGRVTPLLTNLLSILDKEDKPKLIVADSKLGSSIAQLPSTDIIPIANSSTLDIMRAVRQHISSLVPDLAPSTLATTRLGLAHSLSRHQLKFSPEKVDVMIVQAISILDDLDKELNNYAMRVKEWYGWHFPEMAKIINDNLAYARTVLKLGLRSSAPDVDLTGILPEEIEGAIKVAADISMGTEISDEDITEIQSLAEQVVQLTEYRSQLSSYLTARMQVIAPNLTAVVGELVGARLIAHAGSLVSLSKSPASTIQILGAEKALFRALKTKHDTPKYGLIYHASLVGQATGRNKAKMSRMLAAKATLSLRIDSQDNKIVDEDKIEADDRAAYGNNYRGYLENRLRIMEGRAVIGKSSSAIAPTKELNGTGKFNIKEARKYNIKADGLVENDTLKVANIANLDDNYEVKTHVPLEENVASDSKEDDDEDEDDDDEEDDDDNEDDNGAKDAGAKPVSDKTPTKKRKLDSKETGKAARRAAKKAKKEAKREAKAAKKAMRAIKKKQEEGPNKKRKYESSSDKKEKKFKKIKTEA